MNERKVLFEAIWMNWDELREDDDPLVEIKWTVYFDGTVCKRIEYERSGETEPETVRLSGIEFAAFRRRLGEGFLRAKAHHDACDGDGWEMSLYCEEETIVHHVSGYIYGVKSLEKIADALYKMGTQPPHYGSMYVPL